MRQALSGRCDLGWHIKGVMRNKAEKRGQIIMEAFQHHAGELGTYLLGNNMIMSIFKMDQRKIRK